VTAVGVYRVLGRWLPAHAAARTPNIIFMTIAMLLVRLTPDAAC
jgi:hypothetical protein